MTRSGTCFSVVICSWTLLAAGCAPLAPWPPGGVNVPPEVQVVLDDPDDFRADLDDPLEGVEFGAVADDLHELTGCWGCVLTDKGYFAQQFVGVAFFVVYRFDNEDAGFTRWSGWGSLDGSGLSHLIPILGAEVGSYQVDSERTLLLTVGQYLSNYDDEAKVVRADLIEDPMAPTPYERPVLVTLSGDSMLALIGAESPDEVDQTDFRAIFHRFACPSPE